jgi:excinuclease UvrABC ATPase subunit
VRPDIALRLAESFETALALGDGVAYVVSLMTAAAPLVFSDKFACNECGYSMRELEPRLFSFNNPSAPARTATGSACGASSTPSASCAIRSCRSPAARSAAGTGAIPITSR